MKKLLMLGTLAGLLLAQTAPPVQKRDRIHQPNPAPSGPTAGPQKTGPQDGTGAGAASGARKGQRTGPQDGSGRRMGGPRSGRR